MASIDEEIRLDEEENRRELAFIRTQLPPSIKKFYSDKDILWMMDAIVDYYFDSGILESNEVEVDIDLEAVAEHVCKRAKDEGFCSWKSRSACTMKNTSSGLNEEQKPSSFARLHTYSAITSRSISTSSSSLSRIPLVK